MESHFADMQFYDHNFAERNSFYPAFFLFLIEMDAHQKKQTLVFIKWYWYFQNRKQGKNIFGKMICYVSFFWWKMKLSASIKITAKFIDTRFKNIFISF